MDWNKLIEDIIAAGLSEVRLSHKLGVTQVTVNRIRRGETNQPRWPLGDGIITIHRELCKGKK